MVGITADHLQRTGDAVWIACELHCRRIGEVLTLSVDSGLDQITEKRATITDDGQTAT